MPNVKEGTVIDIEYFIKSDYVYSLREWEFQHEIPVAWTEFKAVVPEFYRYKHYFKGYNSLVINDYQSKVKETFSILYEDNFSNTGSTSGTMGEYQKTNNTRATWDLNSQSNIFHFAAENVPAFKNESFMPSKENYLFKLQFELSSTKFPRSGVDSYAKTWESVSEKLNKDNEFGELLNPSGPVKRLLTNIIDESDDVNTKMAKIYSYVKNNYKWNGKSRLYASDDNFSEIIKDKTGNSADLNLLLVALFKEAGLNAYPVALSTRSNGMIVPMYPGVNAFNYIIAYILIGQDYYLFDATDKLCMPNHLPTRCLNGKARIIGGDFTDWIDIKANGISKKIISGNFVINADEGNLIGKLIFKRENYFAYSLRKDIDKYDDIDEYMEEYMNKNHNMDIEEYTVSGVDSLLDPVEIRLKLSIEEGLNQAGDLIFFNPLTIFTVEENPFKSEKRSYPVNFMYPSIELYVMNYQIPDGFIVNEMPQNLNVELPDKTAGFSYTIVKNGNFLRVTLQKNITKTIFNTEEYTHLRDLFNQMISKQSEQIVLKKVS
jgi:hypothetical protein